ncbi:MAG: zinc ribbon domain-containing protein [Chloroflexi bacterium]|nr:zinc ribbon domain-containing protein [Chloroflexota bacterium]
MATLEELLEQLNNPGAKVRLRALYQIGIIGDPGALPVLQQLYQTDPSVDLRPVAQAAIQHIQQTSQMITQDDDSADVAWTQQFVQYLDTSTFNFTSADVQDLVAVVSEQAGQILQNYQANTSPESTGQETGDGVYEMFWDCPFCGAEKLFGVTHRHCPNCGASQDPDYRYFPKPGEEVALKDHRFVGVDRICPACGELSSATANFCGSCGADLSDAQQATRREDQVESEFAENKRDVAAEKYQADVKLAQERSMFAEAAPQAVLLGLTRRQLTMWGGGLAAVLIVLCAGIYFLFFYTQEETVTVNGHSWERIVKIEEFRAVSERRDCTDMPSAAYSVSRTIEERSRQVPDGQECHEECTSRRVDQGDGSFRNDTVCEQVCEPKYRTEYYDVQVCSYTIDRWVEDREVNAGGSDLNPAWPNFILAEGSGSRKLGEERAGERVEKYILELERENGNIAECELEDESTWIKYADGDELVIGFTLTGSPDCDSIK